jgi:hypothetical protein
MTDRHAKKNKTDNFNPVISLDTLNIKKGKFNVCQLVEYMNCKTTNEAV